ncbi:hypothetical protein Q5762_01740 [Streptomyces sp. P9(2023)]|uniref:hypothetical protein n=1 Tax=Streptomyces sp. P9(2023) TaxID=3064394 RepID=UPI0028F44137|nr:hypothetical protein [Streptomyces sp. P9(2023)]MDT9687089.1 hypothetical protein [Streptomyces sp. P9(2023)]
MNSELPPPHGMNVAHPATLLHSADVMNAKTTLLELLARTGVPVDEAGQLVTLIEAGALAEAYGEIAGAGANVPAGQGQRYASGWLDGARTVGDALLRRADRAVREALGPEVPVPETSHVHPPVGGVEVERAKVAVTQLYLTLSHVSELDPEMSDDVLVTVLSTMSTAERAGYTGRLDEFAEARRERLTWLYAEYGPGSDVSIHGRYSLLHSPSSVAVLERLVAAPSALREEWESSELPPVWLEGLAKAWDASPGADPSA